MTITATLVRAGCAAARLPLDLAEGQLLGERRADWPPVLIFDTVESGIKQLVGSLTGDSALVQEGRLERARVAELRKAVELEAVAESHREAADAEHQARVQTDEDRLRQIDDTKAERERRAKQERDAKQQRAEADIERKRAAGARANQTADAAAQRTARAEAAKRIQAEKAAIAKERRAVAAKKKANRVDDRLNATKASRAASKRSPTR
jgi:colicin import membrane protein